MKPEELRKLDCWICHHVFGRKDVKFTSDVGGGAEWDSDKPHPRYYTTDRAAAMLVLEACAQELEIQDLEETVSIACYGPYWVVEKTNCTPNLREEAPTLPLAIARFAKNMFSK